MSKYKVGDELLIIENPNEEKEKLKDLTKLIVNGEYAQISWGLRVINIEYDKPYVTLTYRNIDGKLNKVFAECLDIDNLKKEIILLEEASNASDFWDDNREASKTLKKLGQCKNNLNNLHSRDLIVEELFNKEN